MKYGVYFVALINYYAVKYLPAAMLPFNKLNLPLANFI